VSKENEQFLARWSRRKQEATAGLADPKGEQDVEAHGPAQPDDVATEPPPQEVDLASLPPIESIDAATDVSAFLRKGIPQELRRAALRQAWSADPAIRDFVGLAENAWDFNDPTAMPGFGPLDLSVEQVDALVRRIVGNLVQAAGNVAAPLAETVEDAAQSAPAAVDAAPAPSPVKALVHARPFETTATAALPINSAAPQPPSQSEGASARRRTHGGALPR